MAQPLSLIFRRWSVLLLAVCLLAGACRPVFAAPDTAEDAALGVGYTSVLYDSSSGLPTSEANAIAQSAEGFIWLGGYSGLVRYDGNEFYRYPSSTGIASVVCLYVDARGRLWIGTNENGIAMLENDAFTFYTKENGLVSSSIRDITEDADGNLIVATTMGLAYIDPDGNLTRIDDPQVNTEYVCELKSGSDGLIYGVTLSGAFFTVEDRRVAAFYSAESIGMGVINTICPDPDRPGWVYLGTQGSEIVYGRPASLTTDHEVFDVSPQTYLNTITPLDGQIWVCADNGIGILRADGTYVELKDLPMTNSIDHMMQDYEGNLWFTSSRQGILKIVTNRFVDLSHQAGLDPRIVNTTCRYGEDLFIGTDSGLIVLGADNAPKQNTATALLEGARIRCIRKDSRGRVWLCTYSPNGLVCYDGATDTATCFTEETGMPSNRVRTLMELEDGRLAVATNAGVVLMENDAVTAVYGTAQGIGNLEILCVEEMSDGRILAGSDGDGIYVIDGTGVSRVGLEDGLRSEVILRLKRDPQDRDLFWVITSNSIAYWKDGAVTTIGQFPYSNNFDLYFDRFDRMWVLSSNGIYVVKRADMLAGGSIDYTLYDTRCGLPRVATANSYSELTEDGTLYIAGSTGVTRVNIDDNTDNNSQIRLSVPFVMADDTYIPAAAGGTVHIPADCKRLVIYGNAFTYSLSNPRLSYYLEGFDPDPLEVSKQDMGSISYTNLSGGTYRFHLSILNTMTGQADQTVTVTLIKDKALWENWWFWLAVALLGLGLVAGSIFLYYRRKTAALLRKQEENKRLINEMTSVFARCVDMKDAYTNGHSTRVAAYSAEIARRLGKSDDEVQQIYNIALLHDIGKISIPDGILNKPGRLDDDEFVIMKSHSSRGHDILKDIDIAPELAVGAGYHHERIDGSGYPSGLKGGEIPEVARIIAVADTFDAMYSTRPYRKKMELADVEAELRRCAGTQLDPRFVEVFLQALDEGAFDNVHSI